MFNCQVSLDPDRRIILSIYNHSSYNFIKWLFHHGKLLILKKKLHDLDIQGEVELGRRTNLELSQGTKLLLYNYLTGSIHRENKPVIYKQLNALH